MNSFLFYLQVSSKAWYQTICFYSLRPCFLLFLPKLPILCFVTVKVPQSLRTLLIHTNDCPSFDVIENACTSCWEEWKKKVKMGNQKWRINWVEMELLLLGKENIVLIEVLNCFVERENGDTYALVQRILNSYINYSGNIARKRIDGAGFIEYCLLKVQHFFMASVIYLLDSVCLFQTADGVFSLYNLTSLINEEYCMPPRFTGFICFPDKSLLFPHDNWSCLLI